MAFRGLFVGIDRYNAPIPRLSCAVADALVLAALFEDTLGGEVQSLVDGEATQLAIADALAGLASGSEDDLVVVSFSGHGSNDHRLVPVDAVPGDLPTSCMSLESLAEQLDLIPAKQLLVILDCCFSGGFGGARVFAPSSARSISEDRTALDALAKGSGRLVLTASGAGEPALETVEFGHGLLSYQLINGLQGKDGLATDGRIALLDLFHYASKGVMAAAERLHETQTPTIYGSIEGAPTLVVLAAGKRYAAAFPARVRLPATADWQSLESYGFHSNLLDAWAASMPGLNDLQIEAINDFGVLDGKSLLVVAPTGAGKTMVGELAAMRAVMDGSRAVLLLPLKALVNDKYDYMTATYGRAGKVIRATGDNSDQVADLLSGQYDLALLTYEKFMNLALGSPHIMSGLSVVIVDEVQTIGDPDRGSNLEFLLTLLRAGHGRQAGPQIVALSAVIGDTRGFERWLGGALLRSSKRPVPLRESVIDTSGTAITLEPDGSDTRRTAFIRPHAVVGSQSNKPWVIPLVQRLVQEGKKVIVFRAKKGETVGAARYLAGSLGLAPAQDALGKLPIGDRSLASAELRQFLQGGVGFHNANLDREERQALEQCFRDPESALRVLVATTTLAMGVNTPAEAVVIAGLTHPGQSPRPYSVAEYKNMAGRAGRPGHSEAGESYIVATSDLGPGVAWNRYVLGKPEEIRSHFLSANTDPQTLIVRSLVALGSTVLEHDLVELLENSFALWLEREAGNAGWNLDQLRRAIDLMVTARLIDREPNGNLTLTALGQYAGESGLEVRSITQISSALRFAPQVLTPSAIVTLAQVTIELMPLYIPANRKSVKERQKMVWLLSQLGVGNGLMNGLHVGGGNPQTAIKRAIACLLFMSSRPMREIEHTLMEHYFDRNAAGEIRSVASRTRDVLNAVFQVALFESRPIDPELNSDDLGIQLELGLPNELVNLARLVGAELNRGEYLALLNKGLISQDQVLAADMGELTSIIGIGPAKRLLKALEITER